MRKALEQKAKTLAELNKQCRHTWRVCKDCMAHCEFKDTEQFKGKWVSLEDVEAFLADKVIMSRSEYDKQVHVPRKQLEDRFETIKGQEGRAFECFFIKELLEATQK